MIKSQATITKSNNVVIKNISDMAIQHVIKTQYLYTEGDIDTYVNNVIRHKLGGFKTGHQFLLNDKVAGYYIVYSGAIDVMGQGTPLDFFFNKANQPPPDVGYRDDRKDTFDELMPVLLEHNICESKILFPYNVTQWHWLTGEIILEKNQQHISVTIHAHDPYGGGSMSDSNFNVLKTSLETILRDDYGLEPTMQDTAEATASIYHSQRQFKGSETKSDSTSCGVIVADEIVKRMNDLSLNLESPYALGVEDLRKTQLGYLQEVLGQESNEYKSFLKNVTDTYMINTQYLYENIDVQAILLSRIQSAPSQDLSRSICVQPVANIIVEKQLRQQLEALKPLQQQHKIVIPCNLGADNWAGIILEFGQNGNIVKAECFVSSQLDKKFLQEIVTQFAQVYTGIHLEIKQYTSLKFSVSQCVLVIENLVMAITGSDEKDYSCIETIYDKNLKSLKKILPEFYKGFYTKQLENESTISCIHQALRYDKQFNGIKFSAQELKKILDITGYIHKIENSNLGDKLWQAFKKDKYEETCSALKQVIVDDLALAAECTSFQEIVHLLFDIVWVVGLHMLPDNVAVKLQHQHIQAIALNQMLDIKAIEKWQVFLELEIKEDQTLASKITVLSADNILSECVFRPKDDWLKLSGFSWIHNLGGNDSASEALAQEITGDIAKSKNHHDVMMFLTESLCKQHAFQFFKDKATITSIKCNILNGNPSDFTLTPNIKTLIKFYAHLTSCYLDPTMSMDFATREEYIKRGFLNKEGESTNFFRQQAPYLSLQEAQKQLEGLPPHDALQIFCGMLNKMSQEAQNPYNTIAYNLLRILSKTIPLKETDATQISKYVLLSWDGNHEGNILIHSGHQSHTFYVGVSKDITKENITIRFIVNNFNATAVEKNIQVTSNTNDFYPYVLKFQTSRLKEGSKKGKMKDEKDFVKEIQQISAYISLLQDSTAESKHYTNDKGLTCLQQRELSKIKGILYKDQYKKKEMLQNIQDYIKGKELSIKLFHKYLEKTFDKIFAQDILSKIEQDQVLKAYVCQFIQTMFCLDAIYQPDQYGLDIFQRDQDFEKAQPSFPIQRVGNCTIYNLKSALYPLADLDWRKAQDKKKIIQLNFDINQKVIEVIRATVKDIGKIMISEAERVSNLPMPLPKGSAYEQILHARQLCNEGNVEEAIKVLEVCIGGNCEDGYAFAYLGLIYDMHRKDQNKALCYYKKSLEFIDDPEIALNVSIIYSESGDSKSAAMYFAMANELSPHCGQIYYNQAMACYQKNDKDSCLGHIQKLIAIDPVSSEGYLLMGQLKLDMGQYNEGLYYLCRAGTLGASKTKDYCFTLFKLNYRTFIKLADEYKQVLSQTRNEDDLLQSMHKSLQETFDLMKENYSGMINTGVVKDDDSAEALKLLIQSKNNMIELYTQLCEEHTIEELIYTCLGEVHLNDV